MCGSVQVTKPDFNQFDCSISDDITVVNVDKNDAIAKYARSKSNAQDGIDLDH